MSTFLLYCRIIGAAWLLKRILIFMVNPPLYIVAARFQAAAN
ncbi:hypothetical protein [Stenoxybacter acetivorans]|nr:hypothetical protein [Stenoxybacter acetivorans]